MAMGNTPKKQPVGDRIRDLIDPALEDERRKQIQLGILEEFFQQVTIRFPKMIEEDLQEVFNKAAALPPQERNKFIIEQLTQVDKMGTPLYSPKMTFRVQICTAFTDFTAAEIKNLPSYIALHEAARAQNVALKLVGLTTDESKIYAAALLTIDGSKTYGQGAMEDSLFYPDLPEPPAVPEPFDREKPKRFSFGS